MNASGTSAQVSLAEILERFFVKRLMQQRQVSPHTVRCYRDGLRQLLVFASARLKKAPSQIAFKQIDAALVNAFLDDIESKRNVSAATRNLRLTAIHSFFRYAAFELPTHGIQIQKVLAIPSRLVHRKLAGFLNRGRSRSAAECA